MKSLLSVAVRVDLPDNLAQLGVTEERPKFGTGASLLQLRDRNSKFHLILFFLSVLPLIVPVAFLIPTILVPSLFLLALSRFPVLFEACNTAVEHTTTWAFVLGLLGTLARDFAPWTLFTVLLC